MGSRFGPRRAHFWPLDGLTLERVSGPVVVVLVVGGCVKWRWWWWWVVVVVVVT